MSQSARIKDLLERAYLTPGEEIELKILLQRKYDQADVRKSGLQDASNPNEYVDGIGASWARKFKDD